MSDAPEACTSWTRRLWVLEVLLLAPTVVWLGVDRTPWSWDPAWYGEVSCDLWWTLKHQPEAWSAAMLSAFGIKAPAIAWIGQFFVPLGQAVGNIDDLLMAVPLCAALVTIRLWFLLGNELWGGDPRGGWLMALLGAGAPIFVGITHQFFVEPLQLLGITWLWWLAVRAPQLSRVRLAASAALAGAFLLAVKVTSPAFAVMPAGLIIWRWVASHQPWFSRGRCARTADVLLVAAGVGVGVITAAWYARNLGALREFVAFAAQDDSSLIYGRRPDFWLKWGFWVPAIYREFFNVLVGWGALPLAFIMGLVALRHRQRWQAASANAIVAAAAILQVLIVLWGFSLQIPEITRYSLPLLTSALLPIISLLRHASCHSWVAPLTLAIAAAQWGWSHAAPLGVPPPPRASEWLTRAERDPSYGRELDALIAATTTPASAFRYRVNGYETPWLNANTLSFHAAKLRLDSGVRAYYTSLGYGANNAAAAFERIEAMEADFFISVDLAQHDPRPVFMNQVARPVLERVHAGPEFAPTPFSNQHHIVLYRRVTSRH